MATDEKVMAAVEEELKKNPNAPMDELFAKAKEVSPSVSKLNRRQFNARYPLQIKRRLQRAGGRRAAGGRKVRGRKAAGGGRKAAGARKAVRTRKAAAAPPVEGNRDAVRGALLRFASDLSAAEARKDLVKVLARMDKYVDEILKAASR